MTFSAGVIVFLIAANGYGQSTGWRGLIKNMTPWFRRTERGIAMWWWSTCYVTRGFLATIFFATYVAFDMDFLSYLGWKRGFIFPSLILVIIAILYLLFARSNPEDVGLPKIVENKYEFDDGAKA
ncbi:hypothetical protein MWU78_10805 [Arenibacter sp. F26102]|uniref:hypothetical protein n=1 Tax=Arenibacter sp. F26102 TaxID=2926416 RepID=UPI001FF6D2B5|nr:hypothetical protein [Arenibacter sp. F26102]MCK0146134.1 hypothetical protein [Arenibacter sp. F26102]